MPLHDVFNRSGRSTPAAVTADRPIVLVVDDEHDILATLSDQLRRQFEVITAADAQEGLDLLDRHDVAVVLSDQRMPTIQGAEFLARARAVRPDATRILITGYVDLDAVVDAVNRVRVYAYVEKPWDPDGLEALVKRAAERRMLLRQRDELLQQLRVANAELEQRVAVRTQELEERNRAVEEANRRIEELSRTDPLTGVANRRGMVRRCTRTAMRRADEALYRAKREGRNRVRASAATPEDT